MKKQLHFKKLVHSVLFLAFLGFGQLGFGQNYSQITSGTLTNGEYLIIGDGISDGMMLNSADSTPYINYSAVSNPGATISSGFTSGNVFSINVSGSDITIYNSSAGYVSWGNTGTGTANHAGFFNGTATNFETWTASVASNLWTLANKNTATRLLQWNPTSGSQRFAAYTSNQTKLKLYRKNGFNVSFDKNASDVTGIMSNQTNTTSTALITNVFTRSSYTFAGWNTSADGSGTSYANNANYPFTVNTTLYAQWVLASITWTGATNNLWSVASNWSPAVVPDGSIDVLINTITPNAPVLNVNVTIASGKTVTVSGSGTLTVNPTRTLTVAGSAAFNDRPITFKSDATGTGAFGPVTTPSNVTGATNVTVERYLQGRRANRFLTPSVTTTTSIFTNWQNAGVTTAGIGTHITGSTTGANGFDATTTGNPSLFTYNAQATGTTSGFTPIPNTDVSTLTAGVGYRLLVRGDRTPANITATSQDNMNAATTLSAKGTLTTGTVTFDSTGASPAPVNNQSGNTQTNGYTLIGNPYASPVDWHAVTKTGVAANAYYTWDPTLGTSTQRGRYVVYSQDSGTASLFDDSSAQPLNNRRYLQTGQAVFIKNAVLATPSTLTFSESNKSSTYSYVFRSSAEAVTTVGNSALYLTVYEPNELALGGSAIDGAMALFGSDFSTALNGQDVDKLTTSGENVAFVRESKNLAIETVSPVVANDELFVKTIQFQANKSYTFKVNTQNFDTSVTAKMVDLYLNTQTPINLTQSSFVTFSTTADVNSYGSDRFKIVFADAALGNDTFTGSNVAVYPNPIVNNQFTIALPSSVSGKVTVSMSNMLGQVVYSASSEATSTMLIQPKQQLEEGVYIVSVNSNGNVTQAKVIVKN